MDLSHLHLSTHMVASLPVLGWCPRGAGVLVRFGPRWSHKPRTELDTWQVPQPTFAKWMNLGRTREGCGQTWAVASSEQQGGEGGRETRTVSVCAVNSERLT